MRNITGVVKRSRFRLSTVRVDSNGWSRLKHKTLLFAIRVSLIQRDHIRVNTSETTVMSGQVGPSPHTDTVLQNVRKFLIHGTAMCSNPVNDRSASYTLMTFVTLAGV